MNFVDYEEKREIIDKLEELALEDKYSIEIKEQLFNMITNLKLGTLLQKERYILYYGFDISKERRYRVSEIARMCNCTPSNIKSSVFAMRRALLRLPPDEIKEFEKIVNAVK